MTLRFGQRVWTRQLVHMDEQNAGWIYYPPKHLSFRCRFVKEDGDKHILVRGPDGRLYSCHKCYAGLDPRLLLPACPPYHDHPNDVLTRKVSRRQTAWPGLETLSWVTQYAEPSVLDHAQGVWVSPKPPPGRPRTGEYYRKEGSDFWISGNNLCEIREGKLVPVQVQTSQV